MLRLCWAHGYVEQNVAGDPAARLASSPVARQHEGAPMIASAGVPGTLQPADILAAARAAALGPQPVGWRCCGMSARRSEVGGRAQRGRCRMAQIPGGCEGSPSRATAGRVVAA